MSFINWHKNYVKKSLNMFGLSNYQGFWISFIKGLIFGAVIMWFVGCNEQVVIKKVETTKNKLSSTEIQSDYSIGVKGNCGMCKTTIEKAVIELDFVKDAEWGIKSKILDVKFNDSLNFDLDLLNTAITESGYETMNTTANQDSYDALPMCCKYDRNMQVYISKSD
jgi:copper chaperone CopZ